MGYRLSIDKLENKFYGTKLYGYLDFEILQTLESFKWLKNNKTIDGEDYWYSYNENYIILNSDEIKEFILLYNEDYNKYSMYENSKDIFIIARFMVDFWRF